MRVSQHHDLYRIPLNAGDSADRLIFLYGLEAFGVVGPNIGSRRPVLTRQAFYPYTELPKALYLFIPRRISSKLSREELRGYLLTHADAYLFAWNREHPESRLNARGNAPVYAPVSEARYVQCDGGYSWLHDPQQCDGTLGVKRATAAEVASGRNLFELRFRQYEASLQSLVGSWALAHDYFDLLPKHDRTQRIRPIETSVELVEKRAQRPEELLHQAEWLKSFVPADHPVLSNADYRDETFVYEPVQTDCAAVLSFHEVMEIEQGLMALAVDVERDGARKVMQDEALIRRYVCPHNRSNPLQYDVIHTAATYPELPMAYFLAGLNADRPHGQAIAFYQVLEYEARRTMTGNKSDRHALSQLFQDKSRLPTRALEQGYRLAVAGETDRLRLRGRHSGFDRAAMADLVYRQLRNPTVHAGGGSEDEDQEPAVHPYAMQQYQAPYRQKLRLAREIARHMVGGGAVGHPDSTTVTSPKRTQ